MRCSLLAAALLFSAAACSSGPAPVEMSTYCMREATTLCALATRCGCTFDMAACVASDEGKCNGILGDPELSMAISAGTVRWDDMAAGMLLAKAAQTPMDCGRTLDVFGVTLAQSGTFGGTLLGTLPVGSSCITVTSAPIEECAGGACIAGHCARLVDIGGACDASSLCADLTRPLELISSTNPSAVCSHSVCVRQNAPPGETCTSGAECASSTCTMRACQGLPTGFACIDDAACASLACSGTCQADACGGSPCELGICADLAP